MPDPSDELKIKLIPAQAEFLTSQKRFPMFVGGIGCGKTYMLLLKAVRFCLQYPGSLGMIVRKQYTDLKDSTMNDFRKYFGIDVGMTKEVLFENGSKIMFRHGSEIAVLKNVNLDFVGIEQAEEFDDDTQFSYLRDRLRGKAGPYQQMFSIANCNGHNYIWRKWIYEKASEDYHLITATTFDNAINLPEQFIADQRAREREEPRHYRRMVLNDFSEDLADDNVFRSVDIASCVSLGLVTYPMAETVIGLDVARYGDDEIVAQVLRRVSIFKWKHVHQAVTRHKSVPETCGWCLDLAREFGASIIGVDDTGVGGGVTDLLSSTSQLLVYPFISAEKPVGVSPYPNKRAQAYFKLEEMISKHNLQLFDDIRLCEQLMSIKFYYRRDGVKYIVSKDEMRSAKMRSPDRADALMIAAFFCEVSSELGVETDIPVPGVYRREQPQAYANTD